MKIFDIVVGSGRASRRLATATCDTTELVRWCHSHVGALGAYRCERRMLVVLTSWCGKLKTVVRVDINSVDSVIVEKLL